MSYDNGNASGGGKKSDAFKNLPDNYEDLEVSYVSPEDKILPDGVRQNPAPSREDNKLFKESVRLQRESIMGFFMKVLPSNYVSAVKGPFYTIQFQAAAEELAKIQISAQEIFADSDFDFTRTEFLFQILGAMVFPDHYRTGIPDIEGDVSYRLFLKRMVALLLKGATENSVQSGLDLITDASVQIIEKSLETKITPGAAYTLADQFEFEVNLSKIESTTTDGGEDDRYPSHRHTIRMDTKGNGKTVSTVWVGDEGYAHTHDIVDYEVQPAYYEDPEEIGHGHTLVSLFPDAPFTVLHNAKLVLDALKPAHSAYQYRHLFRDVFGALFDDTMSFDYDIYHYEDFRNYCLGAKAVTGVGTTLNDRSLFRDISRDFSSIKPGAMLSITTGPNSFSEKSDDSGRYGKFRVVDVLTFPVGSSSPAAFSTSSGLSGYVSVSGDVLTAMKKTGTVFVEDLDQDFALAKEGEILSILEGPNIGEYRLVTVLGSNGGKVGFATGPSYRAKAAPSLLRTESRMKFVIGGQSYFVGVDRLGASVPQAREEDATSFFLM
jgi:hypothetical protein